MPLFKKVPFCRSRCLECQRVFDTPHLGGFWYGATTLRGRNNANTYVDMLDEEFIKWKKEIESIITRVAHLRRIEEASRSRVWQVVVWCIDPVETFYARSNCPNCGSERLDYDDSHRLESFAIPIASFREFSR